MLAINFRNRKRIVRTTAKFAAVVLVALWIVSWVIPDFGERTEFSDIQAAFVPAAQPQGGELSKTGGLQAYAADGRFELLADLEHQLFAVKDVRSGIVWRSSPDTTGMEDIRPLVGRNIRSPFEVTYTADYTKTQFTGVNGDGTTWKAYKIDNGIQLHYELQELNIAFIAELTLEDGSLLVRIPEDGIREREDGSALVAVKILPMFGAARQGDEGYMVVPDGSGALIYFDRLHNQAAFTEYSKWIYGTDPAFASMVEPLQGESVAIPAFGAVKPGGGFVQTIREGAADAKVTVHPPGVRNVPFFRGGFEFVFRKQYETSYGESLQSAAIQRIERDRIRSDRAVRIDFAAGEQTDYADLAALASSRLLGPSDRVSELSPPLIQLFLGAESRGDAYSKRMETMTTFAEARMMMEELKRSRVDDFAVELKGWYNQGYFGSLPRRFPVEEAFGGETGLTELLRWTEENGIPTALEDNYSDVYRKERDGVRLRTDTVRRPDGRQLVHHPVSAAGRYRLGTTWYKMNPFAAERDYVPQGLSKLGSLGVESVHLRHVGESLMTDYNQVRPLRRWETQQYYERWIGLAKETLGSVGVYYGNDYAVRHADYVLDTPLRASPHYMLDEPVPFLQMVYHGKVPYYAAALNRSDDARLELLKAIEYGAVPAFELTYRPTTDLRYTNYDGLFSSQYETWLPEAKEAYDAWKEALQPVASQRMTKHERVEEGVYRTTYEDGTRIWVNYNDHAVTLPGMTLDSLGYAVSKGGEDG